jgi:hypothetical protein
LEEEIVKAALIVMAFLFLKTGEKFATQETAGPTVSAFTAYVGEKLGGVKFEPEVLNKPEKAVAYVTSKKPPLGIVTPGFYLAYAKALDMEPVLEVKRQGVALECYVAVVKKSASDSLAGKVIGTTLSDEEHFVNGVILQGKFGDEVRLKPISDPEGAVFDMADGAKDAVDAVLLEEAAWKAFEKDEEFGPKLKVAFRSEELPGQLVVLFRKNAGKISVANVKEVLKAMDATDAGKEMLGSIRVAAFLDVNQARLEKAQVEYAK